MYIYESENGCIMICVSPVRYLTPEHEHLLSLAPVQVTNNDNGHARKRAPSGTPSQSTPAKKFKVMFEGNDVVAGTLQAEEEKDEAEEEGDDGEEEEEEEELEEELDATEEDEDAMDIEEGNMFST